MFLYEKVKKKIEESIRASGSSVTSATTDSETPKPGLRAWASGYPRASPARVNVSKL